MTFAEIERYIACGEPTDKAGAFLRSIYGGYHALVGLSLVETWEQLGEFNAQA